MIMAFGYTCSHSARAERCSAEGVPLAESGRTQKLSSSTAKVLDHPRSGRIASCRISKKTQSQPMLWLRSFFATCYPTGEGEQEFLKIADTRYFALRGESTTKYSGWRCPSLLNIPYGKREASCRISIKNDRFQSKTGVFLMFSPLS